MTLSLVAFLNFLNTFGLFLWLLIYVSFYTYILYTYARTQDFYILVWIAFPVGIAISRFVW